MPMLRSPASTEPAPIKITRTFAVPDSVESIKSLLRDNLPRRTVILIDSTKLDCHSLSREDSAFARLIALIERSDSINEELSRASALMCS